jgi:filamentous hemagglutinin
MKRFSTPSKFRKFSPAHVVLVHALVILTGLSPTPVMADMLSSNLAHTSGTTSAAAPTAPAGANAVDTAAATAQAHAHAQDMLSRNMMALDAMTAMQDAARAAAAGMNNLGANPNAPGTLPNVPDGLVTGGLQINGTPTGATTPQQSLENARTIVTIQQTQQQAMLNWTTFNVGKDTTVSFDQSAGGADAGTWIAFNQITDPSGNPTQILGSIQAQGQVYIINQNGIIFGGGSEVNTHAMVASALPLNDNLVTRGLLNNPDSQFLFSASPQDAGTKGPTPAYTPPATPASGRIGNVIVQAGARITAPTSSANVGGRVALIGPNVTNNGTISTPDGQTILAAGMEVGFDAHSSDDPSLRGLDVYVGDVGSYGGTATNAGLIDAPRGSVVIAGKNVNQDGFINSTTSVALNGRIDLLANYNAQPNINYDPANANFGPPFVYESAISTGIVSVAANSVTQILPEWSSTETIIGTELALKSQINMQGLAVYLGSNAVVYAPNANVAISAGIWDTQLVPGITLTDFVQATGQIYLDHDATIDVSGSTAIPSSLSEYILTVVLRGAELADSALQRNGILRGATITVDLRNQGVRSDGTTWVGTPLANLNGYLGIIQRTVGELTTAGGTVSLSAGESIIVQSGASVNVSGGYQNFDGGYVATTQLLAAGGSLVDIAAADPSVAYSGIYTGSTTVTDPRWGTTTTTNGVFSTSNSHYEQPQSYGAKGGSLAISAASMALDGTFQGFTVTGPLQLDAAPQQSSLSLKFQAQKASRFPLQLPLYSPVPPSITFGTTSLPAAAAFVVNGSGSPLTLRQERRDTVYLSPQLFSSQGFGSLLLNNSDGNIILPADVALTLSAAGSLTLHAASLNIMGTISAPGGSIELVAYDVSPYTTAELKAQGAQAIHPSVDLTRGIITLGSAASLSTAGLFINDRADTPSPFTVPHTVATSTTYTSTIQGGSIMVQGYSIDLAIGSRIDVSGGLIASNNITYGAGGSLSILAGNDPLIASLQGGHLNLGGNLSGISGATGGSLTLQAPTIQIGGTATFANTLLLQPAFFSAGGFSRFTMKGLGTDLNPPAAQNFAPAIVIDSNTVLQPVVNRLQATLSRVGSNSSISLATLLEPEGYRTPVSLDFEAPGISNFVSGLISLRGSIVMRAGSLIQTDALGSVTLHGQTVEMLGSIIAPAGTVTIRGADTFPENTPSPTAFTTLHLGASSLISTAGKTVLLADAYNRRVGSVYAGGTIQIEGNIIADAGALLDVSGTSSVLDLLPAQAGSTQQGAAINQLSPAAASLPVRVDSNGGLLALIGHDFLFSNATLLGTAGGTTAQGGTLQVRSDYFIAPNAPNDSRTINLLVAQDMSTFAPGSKALGYFGANSFLNGGFDSLALGGNVKFQGPVNLTARASLIIADGGVLEADALTTLNAPYVKLGRALLNPTQDNELLNPYVVSNAGGADVRTPLLPTYGTGRLQVTADLLETGFLSLQKIGQASLTATQDLRGNGYLDIAGDLTLTAGQVYPVTASTFIITAYSGGSSSGSVTITSTGTTPAFPLSGGGRLSIYAASITQGGTLRAPFGTITLGWDGTGTAVQGLVTGANVPIAQQITLASGSITSVSAIDPQTGAGVVIPYGMVKDGTNWIDPTGLDITSIGVPDKTIRLSALNVTTAAGSQLDIRGGGELYAYRWVEGNGGTNDILATDSAFAIIPGFSSAYSPFAPNATAGLYAANLGGDQGYANSSLKVGDQIYLKGNALVAAGSYTLLPARYALLPGALLITPNSNQPVDSYVKPGGAVLANGYVFNSLNPAATGTIYQQFEIAPQSVVKVRAEYTDYLAKDFIPTAQANLSLPISRDTLDAGYALISAQSSMQLAGNVTAAGSLTGQGGRVDISSPLDIVIAGPGAPAQANKLVLNATLLSGWNADSLLIGGVRNSTSGVTVRTHNLIVNNSAADPLSGKDIILVASQSLTLAANAVITQSGTQTTADSIVVQGSGALVRVSGVASAQTARIGVTSSSIPTLTVAAGVHLSGPSITLDSTNATLLENSASLSGQSINLNSGRVSLLLDNPGSLPSGSGLVLGGTALTSLQNTTALSLLSYSSLDIYGTGTFSNTGTLALHAAEIRGFNQGAAGSVNLTAQSIRLDNSANGTAVGAVPDTYGSLNFTSATITIGQNALVVDQFATVSLNATAGVLMQGSGSFTAQGALNVVTPFITAASNATQSMIASGMLSMTPSSGSLPTSLGLGAQVSFEGSSVTADTAILLPSGLISLRARTGDVIVGGQLDAGGTAKIFFDQVRYTDGGQVTLTSDQGSVTLGSSGSINVAAAGYGNAGNFTASAIAGQVALNGSLMGQGGIQGHSASVKIDVGSLSSFSVLNDALNAGVFNQKRDLRVRSGSVTIEGLVTARQFSLGVDQGSIVVNGTINASGATGGTINLSANGSVTLNSGSRLTVTATDFDNAGKGGSVTLESGTTRNGYIGTSTVLGGVNAADKVSILAGSVIDLSVASKVAGDVTVVSSSVFQGKFSGTLHIRAPQINTTNNSQSGTINDILVSALDGTVQGASSITVEGYRVYDLTGANGASVAISTATQTSINTNSQSFLGTAGNTSAAYTSITNRLLASNAGLSSVYVLAPGAEIINRTGGLTLGTATSPTASDWDLAAARFGPKSAPGVLTLRASGNLEFYNTLSDGFRVLTTAPAGYTLVERMWLATLMSPNVNLPLNTQSWSFRLVSGADMNAANFRELTPLTGLAANSGSLLLGKDAGQALASGTGANQSSGDTALTRLAINPFLDSNGNSQSNVNTTSNYFQVIRTGTGDIDIYAGRDVQLLNQFATIYTTGVSVSVPGTSFTSGDFSLPQVTPAASRAPAQTSLGAIQQPYAAQYSFSGGNVSVAAQSDIVHLTRDAQGNLILDSSRELPNDWLMRRGYIDPATGNYGSSSVIDVPPLRVITDASTSTSWWVNFSNFFDGIATLGGGNVTLNAGRDVQNVSAHAATNARAARGAPSAAGFLELGGGNVEVNAGRNIDGGIYYVERGTGSLSAGGAITTNSTRSPSLGRLQGTPDILDEKTWMPTALFVGKASFNVAARGDVLLGPVANTFLLPQGLNNKHWYKTYFSSYASNSSLSVNSVAGSITFRQAVTLSNSSSPVSTLNAWMTSQLVLSSGSSANYQPWLRLVETDASPFSSFSTLMPGTLSATAFSGNVNLVGSMTLSPSATGNLEILAAGAVNGLQPTGVSSTIIQGSNTTVWASSTINLSDANPASIPGIFSPYAYYNVVKTSNTNAFQTDAVFLNFIGAYLNETGSTTGINAVSQTKQSLHAAGVLHLNDTHPVRIYAGTGDLSGLTLYSGKSASILAGRDVTDIALYIQNVRSTDVSVVASGRDIVAYNANSVLRSLALANGSITASGETPKSGDIQISGPGSLQVLAGRNLNLGTGGNNTDGTGVGITSIGNGRNPYLPFAGADVLVGAGMGTAADFAGFITYVSTTAAGTRYLDELAELLGVPAVNLNDPALTVDQQKHFALAVFYLALRDAGRDHNDPNSPNAGTYSEGYAAIAKLFPTTSIGSIQTQARDIRTKSGGDISILAPGGGLQLASTLIGDTLAPPGIITEAGGGIHVFASGSVDIGIARIFTLKGGDIMIWSSTGDIAAGSSAKTVQSAPPTRVLIDPQSANVATDLAGLATGGGIGVLATVAGVRPGNVDLIAPVGAVDAGDAGIRATGNLNIAATIVLNAANISVGGTSAGTPAAASVAAPSLGGLASAASSAGAATTAAATQPGGQGQQQQGLAEELPSTITVEVIGYGGGGGDDERKRNEPGE